MMSFNDAFKYAAAIAIIYAGAWVWVTIEDFTGGGFDASGIWGWLGPSYLVWWWGKVMFWFLVLGVATWKLFPRATPETRKRVKYLAGWTTFALWIVVFGGIKEIGVGAAMLLTVFIYAFCYLGCAVALCLWEEIAAIYREWRATFNQSETVSAYAGAQASAPSGAATSHGFDPSRFKKGGKEARHPDDARHWQIVDNPNATDKEKKIARCRIREAEAMRRVEAATA